VADAEHGMPRPVERIVFLGPPGAGKGTQAGRLGTTLGMVRIATGDMLRDAIAQGTALGKQAAPFIDQGGLVPDELLIGMVGERIAREDCREGFILDGFPRTLRQAQGLESMPGGDPTGFVVFDIEVPRDELLRRLSGRRLCPTCQATYHLQTNPPKSRGVCDRDGALLVQREDDKEAAVARRLSEYDARTKPLIDYFRARSRFHTIDGYRPRDVVFAELVSLLEVGE
jgi:adenylate kinase